LTGAQEQVTCLAAQKPLFHFARGSLVIEIFTQDIYYSHSFCLFYKEPHLIMLHTLRRYIVILTLVALSFGAGGKVYLCLSPHGDVHMNLNHPHSSCELVKKCPESADALTLDHHRVKCQSHCRDIAIDGDGQQPPNRNTIQLPSPALMPLGEPPIILARTEKKPSHSTLAVHFPQPALQQSVILLI